jgi:hypothetical protein
MTELVAGMVLAALGAVGLTVALRAIVPVRWVEEIKPWACDLCMSWWSSMICLGVACGLGFGDAQEAIVLFLPSFALAYAIQQRVTPIPDGGPPPPPPPSGQE